MFVEADVVPESHLIHTHTHLLFVLHPLGLQEDVVDEVSDINRPYIRKMSAFTVLKPWERSAT